MTPPRDPSFIRPLPRATRIAPSPTGALHLGNARTFLVNWALARRSGARIVLRIEDLDGPRGKPGAIEQTISILAWLGIDWDEGPLIQSTDLAPYRDAVARLAAAAAAYPCELTRTQIEAAASAPQEGVHETPFPASLRPPLLPRAFDDESTNWRFVVPEVDVELDDLFHGPQRLRPSTSVGDFIIWTKRAQPSYQLAVVVDDARQGVDFIVRGDDLLDSAARQALLYDALELPRPRLLMHLPLVLGPDGKRLAKRHGDTRLDTYRTRGVRAERVIGLIGWWCGIGAESAAPREMSAAEFESALTVSTIPTGPVTFGPREDAWLCSNC